mmetsp:Transcript_11868/g.14358  ORF Transcript_11868/g.14358 Transcript_11868/m.14358 type:complete len:85 (+) Transcript_11868:288-542(+)
MLWTTASGVLATARMENALAKNILVAGMHQQKISAWMLERVLGGQPQSVASTWINVEESNASKSPMKPLAKTLQIAHGRKRVSV